MPDDPIHTPGDRSFAATFLGAPRGTPRGADAFSFLLNSLTKRFPARARGEIHQLIGDILLLMAPSRERVRLTRCAVHALKQWEKSGRCPELGPILQATRSRTPRKLTS